MGADAAWTPMTRKQRMVMIAIYDMANGRTDRNVTIENVLQYINHILFDLSDESLADWHRSVVERVRGLRS